MNRFSHCFPDLFIRCVFGWRCCSVCGCLGSPLPKRPFRPLTLWCPEATAAITSHNRSRALLIRVLTMKRNGMSRKMACRL